MQPGSRLTVQSIQGVANLVCFVTSLICLKHESSLSSQWSVVRNCSHPTLHRFQLCRCLVSWGEAWGAEGACDYIHTCTFLLTPPLFHVLTVRVVCDFGFWRMTKQMKVHSLTIPPYTCTSLCQHWSNSCALWLSVTAVCIRTLIARDVSADNIIAMTKSSQPGWRWPGAVSWAARHVLVYLRTRHSDIGLREEATQPSQHLDTRGWRT